MCKIHPPLTKLRRRITRQSESPSTGPSSNEDAPKASASATCYTHPALNLNWLFQTDDRHRRQPSAATRRAFARLCLRAPTGTTVNPGLWFGTPGGFRSASAGSCTQLTHRTPPAPRESQPGSTSTVISPRRGAAPGHCTAWRAKPFGCQGRPCADSINGTRLTAFEPITLPRKSSAHYRAAVSTHPMIFMERRNTETDLSLDCV